MVRQHIFNLSPVSVNPDVLLKKLIPGSRHLDCNPVDLLAAVVQKRILLRERIHQGTDSAVSDRRSLVYGILISVR